MPPDDKQRSGEPPRYTEAGASSAVDDDDDDDGNYAYDNNDDGLLWALICKTFFFHNEHDYTKTPVIATAILGGGGGGGDNNNHISERDATSVVQIFEQVKTSQNHELELPKSLPEETKVLLNRIGLRVSVVSTTDPADVSLWSASSSTLLHLDKVKNEARGQFHKQIAAVRYDAFDKEVEKQTNLQQQRDYPSKTIVVGGVVGASENDLEAGSGTQQQQQQKMQSYQETSQMASDQRDALAGFVTRQEEMLARPFLHGLSFMFTNQHRVYDTIDQGCLYYWDLDDAALVERGQDFAFAAVELLLVHLRFRIIAIPDEPTTSTNNSTPPVGASKVRRYVLDPQLSNRRIEKLAHLLPSFPYRSPTSGTVELMRQQGDRPNDSNTTSLLLDMCQRTNVDGAKDASCSQDSVFYPILSHCVIL